jgi:D-xylose transport system permease protein
MSPQALRSNVVWCKTPFHRSGRRAVLGRSANTFRPLHVAVGGNANAAHRAGIKVRAVRIVVFMLSRTLAALGGLMAVARLAAADTGTDGGTVLLEAIAAAVIGGVSLFGGRGGVWGAFFGSLVIGSVFNGLDLTGNEATVKYMVEGLILLIAVTADVVSRRGRLREEVTT